MSKLEARLAIALLVMSLVIVIVGCINEQQGFGGFLEADPSEVTKVNMRCGTTGNLTTVEDPETIGEFIGLLQARSFEKSKDQGRRAGYLYYADFISGGEELLRVTFHGKLIVVDQTYYNVSEEITREELDKFFSRHMAVGQ